MLLWSIFLYRARADRDHRDIPTHAMVLVLVHDTGVEEWQCPACGFRFVLQRQPLRRIVLKRGADGQARHEWRAEADDPYLAPFARFLRGR